jgi:hypothetical protein
MSVCLCLSLSVSLLSKDETSALRNYAALGMADAVSIIFMDPRVDAGAAENEAIISAAI